MKRWGGASVPHVPRQSRGAHFDDPPDVHQLVHQRLRTTVHILGPSCYPLTAAVESHAQDLDALITEMHTNRQSERAGRLIDGEGSGSMESKKTEGYF